MPFKSKHFKGFFELGQLRCNNALSVHDKRCTIKNKLVLSADQMGVNNRQTSLLDSLTHFV